MNSLTPSKVESESVPAEGLLASDKEAERTLKKQCKSAEKSCGSIEMDDAPAKSSKEKP